MRQREIIGTDVSITDHDEVADAIDAAVAADERIYVCCAPASSLVFARDDSRLAAAFDDAAVITPDGMGVVLAARLLGEKIRGRVYGPDLMQQQLGRAAQTGTSVFLYGGHDQQTLDNLVAALSTQHPDLRIAGSWLPPHRELTDAEKAEVADRINLSGAQIVWVGIGSPKQELWMHELRPRLTAPVLVGVGAAFDFFSGRVSQAPRWMRRAGLEWVHRIFRDPGRMIVRYLVTLPRFAALVLAQAVRAR